MSPHTDDKGDIYEYVVYTISIGRQDWNGTFFLSKYQLSINPEID